jgi:glycosyltransferase involved in cell wall biosynthesis
LATKIVEYMMVGTPVLASNFDAWRPFVEGERVGRMADPQDMDDILDACERMLDDMESLETMSRNGQAAVADKYNWDREFEKLQGAYERCLAETG